ncbi:MAG: diaminopimelate decarboxylase [Candidatus Diapherotrites archaeon]
MKYGDFSVTMQYSGKEKQMKRKPSSKRFLRPRWSYLYQDSNGMLYIDDYSVRHIAQKFGTPLHVMIESELRSRMRRIQRAFPYPKLRIQYAGKNNSNLEIIRIAREEGMEFDASSVGEIILGLLADFEPKQITYTNLYKREEDIAFAAEVGVQAITADSMEELKRFERVGAKLKTRIRTFIRVNPLIKLGHYSTKLHQYGIPYPAVKKALMFAIKAKHIDLVGLHFHGGYIYNPKIYSIAAEKMLKLMKFCYDNNCRIKFIDLGGGFPVDYNSKSFFIPEDMGERLVKDFNKLLAQYNLPQPRLIFEPGKFITANSGMALVKVVSKKMLNKTKVVVVDGSTYGLVPDVLIYKANYDIIPATKMNRPIKGKWHIAGCTCDSIDVLGRHREMPELEEDDLLAIMDCGAYSNVMASNFNTLKRAPIVLVKEDGTLKLIRRRDRYSEMFAPELDILKFADPNELRKYYAITRTSLKRLWEGSAANGELRRRGSTR